MDGFQILNFECLDSTNLYAKENLNSLDDKIVVASNRQTQGRGRFQREWLSSNSQNIYASIVLKPKIKDIASSPISNITQYLSVILCEIFESYKIVPAIKWPNDILVSKKKISGILAETKLDNERNFCIILGVGININSKIEELQTISQPATSLNIECNTQIDKDKFLRSLLNAFFAEYETFLSEGFSFIKSRYIKRCSFLGTQILIKNLDSEIRGIAKSINDDGSLQLGILGENKETKILAGDIV